MDNTTQPPQGYYDPEATSSNQPSNKPSTLPIIAGTFLIIAALSGFLTYSQLLASDVSYFENFLPANSPITAQEFQSTFQVCSIIGIVFSALAFVGGLMAYRRRSWGFAMIGSILGILTIGLFFTASILSFIALILLIISRKQFTTPIAPTPPPY